MEIFFIAIIILILTSILALFLTGNSQKKAKEMRNEVVTGTLGKVILGGVIGIAISLAIFIPMAIHSFNEPVEEYKPNPGKYSRWDCEHYDGTWDEIENICEYPTEVN